MINPVEDCDAPARLERALARVEAATLRLQRQRSQAQARYELLDRTGSEILATIDTLLAVPEAVELHIEPLDKPRGVKPAVSDLAATADAA